MTRRDWLFWASCWGIAAGLLCALAFAGYGRAAIPATLAMAVGGAAAGRVAGAVTWTRIGRRFTRHFPPNHHPTKENR
jgi:hypothetical protein